MSELLADGGVLAAHGAKPLGAGRHGLEIGGWRIETKKRPILAAADVARWEKLLGAFRLPEMVFGHSEACLHHLPSGVVIHFNALDALHEWKRAKLPPIKIPAAEAWELKSKPAHGLVLDYDYTFTTPYAGSLDQRRIADEALDQQPLEKEMATLSFFEDEEKRVEIEGGGGRGDGRGEGEEEGKGVPCADQQRQEPPSLANEQQHPRQLSGHEGVGWVEAAPGEGVDYEMLQQQDPILFYDEVILYEDELNDSGIAMLSIRMRVMPRCWFLLLRFWLRVDGAALRLYETRMFCPFLRTLPSSEGAVGNVKDGARASKKILPLVVRERVLRESSFKDLASKGYPGQSAFYADPSKVANMIPPHIYANERLDWKS